ncbi:hypothetical protein DPMN_113228 [Dreissena polymorpha]|uniref:Uncharacterized protein n=1 Tax=Dreissena polymorpha TaxID=45954 RepID=A0A9D4QQH8_DREPO|nr:hypothetical protein DPMN_113228 [Dreissena polymorpha]
MSGSHRGESHWHSNGQTSLLHCACQGVTEVSHTGTVTVKHHNCIVPVRESQR